MQCLVVGDLSLDWSALRIRCIARMHVMSIGIGTIIADCGLLSYTVYLQGLHF